MFGEITYTAKASLDSEGRARVSVTAICPYGTRTASATVEVENEQIASAVEKALSKAIKEAGEAAKNEAYKGAAEGVTRAMANGEEL
jgi:hypothetical protein